MNIKISSLKPFFKKISQKILDHPLLFFAFLVIVECAGAGVLWYNYIFAPKPIPTSSLQNNIVIDENLFQQFAADWQKREQSFQAQEVLPASVDIFNIRQTNKITTSTTP